MFNNYVSLPEGKSLAKSDRSPCSRDRWTSADPRATQRHNPGIPAAFSKMKNEEQSGTIPSGKLT